MNTQTTTSLTRKLALGLSALVVSTMTVAGAAQAKSKFNLTIHLGGWGGGATISGNLCNYHWYKYEKTGKYKYYSRYMRCMGYW